MFLDELKQTINLGLINLNNGDKSQAQVISDLNQAINEFTERVTSKDDVVKVATTYIRKHFAAHAGAMSVADALISDAYFLHLDPSKMTEKQLISTLFSAAKELRYFIEVQKPDTLLLFRPEGPRVDVRESCGFRRTVAFLDAIDIAAYDSQG